MYALYGCPIKYGSNVIVGEEIIFGEKSVRTKFTVQPVLQMTMYAVFNVLYWFAV